MVPALVTKSLDKGFHIVIQLADDEALAFMDQFLWNWRVDSFLPHSAQKDGFESQQPIWLTKNDGARPDEANPKEARPDEVSPNEANPNDAKMMIACQTKPQSLDLFTRCAFLFDGRDEAERERALAYRQDLSTHHNLTFWRQGQKGWDKE